MKPQLRISVNHNIFIKDPDGTELGRKILMESVKLIDELGFENFTFKKLANRIGSTEASVYRYFENKHRLLVYLFNYYWSWMEYRIDFKTNNIKDPFKKLKIIIDLIAEHQDDDPQTYIDESVLHKIVISEAAKAYLTKEVDEVNRSGFYTQYKEVCKKIAGVVLEINPGYPYPNAMVSTIIDTAHNQLFFASHLPSLTEIKSTRKNQNQINTFLEHILISCVK